MRAIAQAGLYPSNCRILDPAEAYNTGAADGTSPGCLDPGEGFTLEREDWARGLPTGSKQRAHAVGEWNLPLLALGGFGVRHRQHTSVEVDISCFNCHGKGYMGDGSRCPLCKGECYIDRPVDLPAYYNKPIAERVKCESCDGAGAVPTRAT